MAVLQGKVLQNLDDLIRLGEKVISTKRHGDFETDVDSGIHTQWLTRSFAFFERVFGRDSEYYKRAGDGDLTSTGFDSPDRFLNHLLAIKADVEAGALFETQQIVEADVFDDILEQAEHLHKAGYFAPAAVVAGCVLEDGLRRMCQKAGVALPNNPKLDAMNSELAKAGIYQKLTQKKIAALADIRNSAAHGKWSEFTPDDVGAMLRDVRDFVTRHFT